MPYLLHVKYADSCELFTNTEQIRQKFKIPPMRKFGKDEKIMEVQPSQFDSLLNQQP